MRRKYNNYSVGQIIECEIVEAVSTNEFIVSLYGTLIRVRNKTPKGLKPKQKIKLCVTHTKPLSFKLADSSSYDHLNLNI